MEHETLNIPGVEDVITEEQRDFSDFIIDSIGYTPEQAGKIITHRGKSMSLRDGLAMCMDHIFAADWDETQIKLYADQLLATSAAAHPDAS